ncbi:uncharacterized protein LOC119371655 isoform X2 [Rhipicephalus sanguineus]|uniref:uncharacterized protein LOC119371655 isoform X2 n=1 Tax=Rhipicephalus sanguineus TaxID=34632 RepID=UPI001893A187|nr:uncharacterized protein LOC119371655 isoform X2 [Rhipicephalus sanguineus]
MFYGCAAYVDNTSKSSGPHREADGLRSSHNFDADPYILGDGHLVHLDDVAKQYIKKVNATYKGQVRFWGLTKEFSYWRHPTHTGKHPVKAKVVSTSYTHCQGTSSLKPREGHCQGSFHWNIKRGIDSPFSIKMEEQVPVLYRGLRRRQVKLEMNGLTTETFDERWRRLAGPVRRKLVKACAFKAEIEFDGYFVYMLTHPEEGNFRWVLVSITQLQDTSKGLQPSGTKLTYVAKGVYVER